MNQNPKSLTELANNCPTDKGTKFRSCHGFTEFYEPFISKFRNDNKTKNILEIGVDEGKSLQLWDEYFESGCNIIGLDIDDKTHFNTNNITCFQLDQGKEEHLEHYKKYFQENDIKFDIILDDGSHHMKDQILTFTYFIDSLSDNGVYFIEDLHTSLGSNRLDLYGKPLDINPYNENTTLYWLLFNKQNKYLTPIQQKYCEDIIDTVNIYNKHNPSSEDLWGYRSISSAITKRKIIC